MIAVARTVDAVKAPVTVAVPVKEPCVLDSGVTTAGAVCTTPFAKVACGTEAARARSVAAMMAPGKEMMGGISMVLFDSLPFISAQREQRMCFVLPRQQRRRRNEVHLESHSLTNTPAQDLREANA